MKNGYENCELSVTPRGESPTETAVNQVSKIGSAVLNIGTAASDCASARDAWIDANWDDSVMWINNAIAQLESARAKIVKSNADLTGKQKPEKEVTNV